MISHKIASLFGGIWKIKTKCNTVKSPLIKKFYLKLYQAIQLEYSCFIGWNSVFKGQPCFPHGCFGVFISGASKIGKNCIIFQHVTIGSNTIPDSKSLGAPTIGDNCYIGAGAKIIGNVTIGNNVRIGANSVVYKDVPDNTVVVSSIQNNIQKDNSLNNKYYTYGGKWLYFDDGKWIEEKDDAILDSLKVIC